MPRARTVSLGLGVPIVAALALYVAAHDYVRGATFVVEAADLQGALRAVAQWETQPVTVGDLPIPWRGGELPGRQYSPARRTHRPVLVVPGVHADGIDEPRLVAFARVLASVGHPVITAGLPDLQHYRITPRSTDMIEDAAAWLASRQDLAADGRIGMIGISFAGGLSVVAAGREALRDRVAFVLSFGGHGDLPRTLRYLCTGVQPDGTTRPPHDYGVAIILLGAAERLVPADQVDPLSTAILTFLDASRLDMFDKPAANSAFARARQLAAALPEPARTLMSEVNARDVAHLGPRLLPHLSALGGNPALSPERSPRPVAPVFLLHGTDDNVIPAVESELLANDLRAHGVPVRRLATPLVTHAEVDRTATASAVWELVSFWTDVLGR